MQLVDGNCTFPVQMLVSLVLRPPPEMGIVKGHEEKPLSAVNPWISFHTIVLQSTYCLQCVLLTDNSLVYFSNRSTGPEK